MPMPKENDQVTGNKGTYVIGKLITKGPSAVSHVATDATGHKMFLKAYLSPKSSSGMYTAYLDYEVELNQRLENDHDLKQQSVYAVDVFSAPLVSRGRKNPFPMLFQVFPFVSGNLNLNDLIETGIDGRPLTWDERKMAANIFTFAMSRLHRVKIVHGDLKPENVQMTRVTTTDGSLLLKPLLVDMDGSVLADRPAPWAEIDERTGEKYSGYVGTAGYFSPEHLRGKVPVPASDVFTASIILCQLLAGVHPFASSLEDGGDGYPKAAVAGKHDFLRKRIPFLGAAKTDTLEKALIAALDSDPAKRPTMNVLHEEVVRLKKGTVVLPPPPPPIPSVTKESTTEPAKTLATGSAKIAPKISTTATETSISSSTKTASTGAIPGRLVLSGATGKLSTGGNFGPNQTTLRRLIGDDARFTGSIPQFLLTKEGGMWFVAPTTAKNPTFLNGNRLSEKMSLKNGDTLSIGPVRGVMKVSFMS